MYMSSTQSAKYIATVRFGQKLVLVILIFFLFFTGFIICSHFLMIKFWLSFQTVWSQKTENYTVHKKRVKQFYHIYLFHHFNM